VKQQLETIRFRLFKNDSNYRSGRKLTLIQVPQNTPQIKTKRFITKTICRHAAVMANAIEAKAISQTVDILLFNYLLGDHLQRTF
jgi:hypothetical protein